MNRHRSNWSAMGTLTDIESYNIEHAYRDMRTALNYQKINRLFTNNSKRDFLIKSKTFIDMGYSGYVYGKINV